MGSARERAFQVSVLVGAGHASAILFEFENVAGKGLTAGGDAPESSDLDRPGICGRVRVGNVSHASGDATGGLGARGQTPGSLKAPAVVGELQLNPTVAIGPFPRAVERVGVCCHRAIHLSSGPVVADHV